VDTQAGIEMTFSILTNFLTGATLVHDVGYIEYGSTSSMEALVIADEIIREARFLTGGLDINPTTLALDVIARIKPGTGFLVDDHTLKNFRTSQWIPRIIDRSRYDSWKAAGAKDMYTRANERAREILAEHEVTPLSEDSEAVITEVLAERAA
ncbi:MAG: trimethylamine methyltransferase family protein, partial [Anaerolineales bacterium]